MFPRFSFAAVGVYYLRLSGVISLGVSESIVNRTLRSHNINTNMCKGFLGLNGWKQVKIFLLNYLTFTSKVEYFLFSSFFIEFLEFRLFLEEIVVLHYFLVKNVWKTILFDLKHNFEIIFDLNLRKLVISSDSVGFLLFSWYYLIGIDILKEVSALIIWYL